MFDFTYEDQGANKYLVYEKKAGDVVDTMSLGMLSNNKISGIVPFMYTQVDDTVYMKYNISGLISLREYMEGVVNRKKILGILDAFSDAVIGTEDYMLEYSVFVLNTSFIYVNTSANQVMLVALPVERAEISIDNFLRQLIFGVQYDPNENGSYITALISFFNSSQMFSIYEFKKLVQKLKEENIPSPINQLDEAPRSINQNVQRQTIYRQSQEYQQTAATRQPQSYQRTAATGQSQEYQQTAEARQLQYQNDRYSKQNPEWEQATGQTKAGMGQRNMSNESYQKEEKNTEEQVTDKKEKKGLFGKKDKKIKKEKEPKEKRGLFGKKEDKKKEKKGAGGGLFGNMVIPGNEDDYFQKSENGSDTNKQLQGGYGRREMAIPEQNVQIEKHKIAPQDFGDTVDLKTYVDDTVVLDQTQQAQSKSPYIKRCCTNECYPIYREITRIGRDADQTDICLTGNNAISHVHAILHLKNGEATLEDNGSRNGTYVDNMRIQTWAGPALLNHGSRIILGNEELEFYMY